jgi:hypothetical protein
MKNMVPGIDPLCAGVCIGFPFITLCVDSSTIDPAIENLCTGVHNLRNQAKNALW